MVVPPGRGFLGFQANDSRLYATLEGGSNLPGPETTMAALPTPIRSPERFNALTEIDPSNDHEAKPVQMIVRKGVSITCRLLDLERKPLMGQFDFQVGSTNHRRGRKPSEQGEFQVENVIPDHPRRATVWHNERKLVGRIIVQAEDADKIREIELKPWGEVKGRVLGGNGQPVGPLTISCSELKEESYYTGISFSSTDEDGRFHLKGLVPGKSYMLTVRKSISGLSQILNWDYIVGSGEVKDLGDVTVKNLK